MQQHIDLAKRIKSLVENSLAQQFLRGYSVETPQERHETYKDSVPIGYLGQCPRNKALERRNHPVRFEGKSWKDSIYAVNRVREGNKDEEMILDALHWAAIDGKVDAGFDKIVSQLNVNSVDHEGVANLHGRLDALVSLDGNEIVLELKSSQWGKLYNWMVFQLLGYMLVTGTSYGFIVQKNGAIVKIYALVPVENGFKVYDDEGNEWKHAMNNPKYLNFERVHGMAKILNEYLAMNTEQVLETRPIADPLNSQSELNELAFGDSDPQCVTYSEKPKAYKRQENKPGFVRPACGHWCHDHITQADTDVAVGIDDNETVFVSQILQEPVDSVPVIKEQYVPEITKPVTEEEDEIFNW